MRTLYELDYVSVVWKEDGVYIAWDLDDDDEGAKIGETIEEAIIELRKIGEHDIADTLERGETYVYGRREPL